MPTKYRNRRSSQLKNIKGGCWRGYERVPGTIEFSKGSCRKIGSAAPKSNRRRKLRGGSLRRSKSRRRRRSKSCTPGANKKFATLVNNKCIRFGDPNMTIKKNITLQDVINSKKLKLASSCKKERAAHWHARPVEHPAKKKAALAGV